MGPGHRTDREHAVPKAMSCVIARVIGTIRCEFLFEALAVLRIGAENPADGEQRKDRSDERRNHVACHCR
jgi:hypothetical protein